METVERVIAKNPDAKNLAAEELHTSAFGEIIKRLLSADPATASSANELMDAVIAEAFRTFAPKLEGLNPEETELLRVATQRLTASAPADSQAGNNLVAFPFLALSSITPMCANWASVALPLVMVNTMTTGGSLSYGEYVAALRMAYTAHADGVRELRGSGFAMSFSGFTRLDPRPGTHNTEPGNLTRLWGAMLNKLEFSADDLAAARAMKPAEVVAEYARVYHHVGGCHMLQLMHWHMHASLPLRPRHAWLVVNDLNLTSKVIVAGFGYTEAEWRQASDEWKYNYAHSGA